MTNLRHQIKSRWYYIFWGSMAVAVVSGQVYVGLGYREMAEATKSTQIHVTCDNSFPLPVLPYAESGANRTRQFE